MISSTGFSRTLALAVVAGFFPPFPHAEIRLPGIFGSHMVMQQGKPIILWGWAIPGETATAQLGAAQSTIANDKGGRKLSLPAMKASGPQDLQHATALYNGMTHHQTGRGRRPDPGQSALRFALSPHRQPLEAQWPQCHDELTVPANSSATIITPDGKQHEAGPGKHQFKAVPP